MALFSRRKKPAEGDASERAEDVESATADASVEPARAALQDAPVTDAPIDGAPIEGAAVQDGAVQDAAAAASVDITLSSYRALGSAPVGPLLRRSARMPPAAARPATDSVPGLRDNVLLRDALSLLPPDPSQREQLNAARQFMQGHVFLRVQGDARTLLSEGKPIPLASTTIGERRFVLAYSSGAALQASFRSDGDLATSAMGQPVLTVIRHVLAGGFDGIIIDPASAPSRLMVTRELLERALGSAKEPLAVKTLLAEPRADDTAARVADALIDAPLWVAVGSAPGEPGQPGGAARMGVAEARTPDGRRLLEIFSHPLEVAALGRQDRPLPFTAAQLGRALRGQRELSGVIVDPGGPWIELSREDLAPVIALSPEV